MAGLGAVSRARVMRRAMTPPEARLWVCLRRRGVSGLKFRRQHPIGNFVFDFYCVEARLAVEVDGEMHRTSEVATKDRAWTAWLGQSGISVLRLSAEEVRTNLDSVLGWIRQNAEERVRG